MPTVPKTVFAVYAITHVASGRRYVGHTYRLRIRLYQHRFHLDRGDHHCRHLQNAWNKYGADAFIFAQIGRAESEEAVVRLEQQEIDASPCYNSAPSAASCRGVVHTAETRGRMAAWQKGTPKTEAHRAKIAATLTGRARDPEATRKQAAKMRLVLRDEAWCGNIRAAAVARLGTEPVTAFGRTQHVNEWAKECGINPGTLRNRLNRAGMSLENALTAPLSRGKSIAG